MEDIINFKDKVENITGLLRLVELSEKAAREHEIRSDRIEELEEIIETEVTECRDKTDEKYYDEYYEKVNIQQIARRNRFIACIIAAAIYLPIAAIAFISGLNSEGVIPAMLVYGTVIASIWLAVMIHSDSTVAKVVLGVLTFGDLGMFAGAICIVLYQFLREEYVTNLSNKYERKRVESLKNDPSYIKDYEEATLRDKSISKARAKKAKEELKELKKQPVEYDYLYKQWLKLAEGFLDIHRDNNYIKNHTTEYLVIYMMKHILRYIKSDGRVEEYQYTLSGYVLRSFHNVFNNYCYNDTMGCVIIAAISEWNKLYDK